VSAEPVEAAVIAKSIGSMPLGRCRAFLFDMDGTRLTSTVAAERVCSPHMSIADYVPLTHLAGHGNFSLIAG
jgi:hypothetical protein